MPDPITQQLLDQLITKENIIIWLEEVCNWRFRWNELSFSETMLHNYLMDSGFFEESDSIIDGSSVICINHVWYDLPDFIFDFENYFMTNLKHLNTIIVTRNEVLEYFKNN